MKVAAYQMGVDTCYGGDPIASLRACVRACEAQNVSILCCPEGAIGGLADYVADPAAIAVPHDSLTTVLAPIASTTVTTVVGVTEQGGANQWYNTAVVYSRGEVCGLYRKHHPAIRRSRYTAGNETPVFVVEGLTIGILICRDSTDRHLAAALVARGATVLFIPTNNAMPADRGGPALAAEARSIDRQHARALGIPIVRADVIGDWQGLRSEGASAITTPNGEQVCAGRVQAGELLVAELML